MSLWNWWIASRRKHLLDIAEKRVRANDFRAVGPLIEALEWPDVRDAAEVALIRLLPRLPAADLQRLSHKQRLGLYRALSQKNEALTLAILDVLQTTMGWEATAYLHNLKNAHPKTEVQRRIQRIATERLQEFEASIKNASSLVLMRPALPPGVPLSTRRLSPEDRAEPHDA